MRDRLDEIDKERDLSDRDSAQMLAALRAVLELHRKQTGETPWSDMCEECVLEWPCQTYRAIKEALR